MRKLIDMEAAIDIVRHECGEWEGLAKEIVKQFNSLPPVDAVPVRRGRWLITDAYPHNVYCSQCYKTFAQTHWAVWEDGTLPRNFCPNCGADMREGGGNETD